MIPSIFEFHIRIGGVVVEAECRHGTPLRCSCSSTSPPVASVGYRILCSGPFLNEHCSSMEAVISFVYSKIATWLHFVDQFSLYKHHELEQINGGVSVERYDKRILSLQTYCRNCKNLAESIDSTELYELTFVMVDHKASTMEGGIPFSKVGLFKYKLREGLVRTISATTNTKANKSTSQWIIHSGNFYQEGITRSNYIPQPDNFSISAYNAFPFLVLEKHAQKDSSRSACNNYCLRTVGRNQYFVYTNHS